jgi:DNA helicase HerA-like ATPase
MKLNPEENVEEMKAGRFVVVRGEQNLFFSMITDVRLHSTSPAIAARPPALGNRLMREVLRGTGAYADVRLKPMLAMPTDGGEPEPVKSIPAHFAAVHAAREDDVGRVFGSEKMDDKHFEIGTPLDMSTPVCIDLERFVERSNGVFGKTGTGKTFFTRLVLSGLIRSSQAVNLVFDMHGEYGWGHRAEGSQTEVKGLKALFRSQVSIFTLDPESTRARGVSADRDVYIPYSAVSIDDIALIGAELRLNETAVESAHLVENVYHDDWLKHVLEDDTDSLMEVTHANPQSLAALQRKLKSHLGRLTFLRADCAGAGDPVQEMLDTLDRGMHVMLEFGRLNQAVAYLLVTSIITRRIHERYVDKTEEYLGSNYDPKKKPRQLVITVEEAHKFLNPEVARETIFGVIAREMRKYFVSLLVVDQRPSAIDDEVLSQLGTRITAQLSDEKDIDAVLTGVQNARDLKAVLAGLESKEQALLLGHAVPMPVVVHVRKYDEKFYAAMKAPKPGGTGSPLPSANDLYF